MEDVRREDPSCDERGMSLAAFSRLLTDERNDIMDPSKASVYQDMSRVRSWGRIPVRETFDLHIDLTPASFSSHAFPFPLLPRQH